MPTVQRIMPGDLLPALPVQVALLAGLTLTVGLGPAGWLAGLACAAALVVGLTMGMRRLRATGLGPADRITLARASLVCGVTALVADGFAHPARVAALVGLSAVALALDAVDGWAARRTATASRFGAGFDMEVDAFLILVLSVQVARELGPWVLLIGAARYLLLVAGRLLPWLRATVPPRFWRKVVAAVQGVVLAVAASTLLPTPVESVALLAALGLLAESFGRDVVFLARQRVDGRELVTT